MALQSRFSPFDATSTDGRRPNQEQSQICRAFLREFKGDTRRAEREARREGVEDEFKEWFFSSDEAEECRAPARGIAVGPD